MMRVCHVLVNVISVFVVVHEFYLILMDNEVLRHLGLFTYPHGCLAVS